MLTARKTMDVVAAFRDVGTYRGAAEICGVDPKTVKRKVLAHEAGQLDEQRAVRAPVVEEHRRGPRPGRPAGGGDEGEDHRQAAPARSPCGRLCRVGEELPAAGRRREEAVAGRAWPSAPPGGVDPGRHAGDRLGHAGGHGDPCVLCRVGMVEDPFRPVRPRRDRRDHVQPAGRVLRGPRTGCRPRCWRTGWAV